MPHFWWFFVYDICFLRVFKHKKYRTCGVLCFVSVSEFLVLCKKNGSRSNLRFFFPSKVFLEKGAYHTLLKQLLFALTAHPSFWMCLFLISPHSSVSLPPLALQSFPAAAPLTSALNNKAVCLCREELKQETDGSFITRLLRIELDLLFFSRD